MKPVTLVRVGNFEGNLEETFKRYDPRGEQIVDFTKLFERVGVYGQDPDHLVIASRSLIKSNDENQHNLTFSVTSESDSLNQRQSEEFEGKTGIVLRDAPETYLKYMPPLFADRFRILKRGECPKLRDLFSIPVKF